MKLVVGAAAKGWSVIGGRRLWWQVHWEECLPQLGGWSRVVAKDVWTWGRRVGSGGGQPTFCGRAFSSFLFSGPFLACSRPVKC